MVFWEEFRTALEEYPDRYVRLDADWRLPPQFTPEFNLGELLKCTVRIDNGGDLVMHQVKIRIEASPYADLTEDPFAATPVFVQDFITEIGSVPAHAQATSNAFFVRAIQATPGSGEHRVVDCTLEEWDAGLEHLLNRHSPPAGTVSDSIKVQVRP